jgi:hypothetical protein
MSTKRIFTLAYTALGVLLGPWWDGHHPFSSEDAFAAVA